MMRKWTGPGMLTGLAVVIVALSGPACTGEPETLAEMSESGIQNPAGDREAVSPPSSAEVIERSQQAMPDFELNDLEGAAVRLSDYSGRIVFVNFWATWCPPCKAELPDLVEIQREFGGDDFVILGVSLDHTGPDAVRKFVQEAGLNYPILMGNQQVVTDYGNFRGIPTSFLLNAKHEKVKQYVGLVTKSQLTRDLQALLGDPA